MIPIGILGAAQRRVSGEEEADLSVIGVSHQGFSSAQYPTIKPVNIPAGGRAGDMALLVIYAARASDAGQYLTPTGWVRELQQVDAAGSGYSMVVFSRVLSGGETTVTLTSAVSTETGVDVVVVRGATAVHTAGANWFNVLTQPTPMSTDIGLSAGVVVSAMHVVFSPNVSTWALPLHRNRGTGLVSGAMMIRSIGVVTEAAEVGNYVVSRTTYGPQVTVVLT